MAFATSGRSVARRIAGIAGSTVVTILIAIAATVWLVAIMIGAL
jgi:hypothetical protein